MTPTPTAAARVSGTIKARSDLLRDALRFAFLAAGEGIEIDGLAPEDFLMAYSDATGDEDWDTFADRLAAIQPDPEPKPADPISDYWDGRSAYRSATGSPHDFTAPAMPRDQLSPEARKDWLLNGAPRVWLEVDGGGPWFVKPVQPSREYLRSDLATPSSAGMVSVEAAALESIADEMRETYREMLIGKMPTELEVNAWAEALRALAGEGER